jgi:hypothetical protein
MRPDATAVEVVFRILFLFGYALLFAAVEIEIEGPHGWAERLPTWFRITPWYARAYGLLMRGKPLTGYHATMFGLSLWSFHIGFVAGVPWSWPAEAAALSAYLVWSIAWDLMWFLLNPRYGWPRFRKGQVWWHGRTWLGRFPIDYYNGVLLSIAVAASARLAGGGFAVLGRHLAFSAGLALFTLLAAAAAPAYMRWYERMRRPGSDERHLCLPDQGSKLESKLEG